MFSAWRSPTKWKRNSNATWTMTQIWTQEGSITFKDVTKGCWPMIWHVLDLVKWRINAKLRCIYLLLTKYSTNKEFKPHTNCDITWAFITEKISSSIFQNQWPFINTSYMIIYLIFLLQISFHYPFWISDILWMHKSEDLNNLEITSWPVCIFAISLLLSQFTINKAYNHYRKKFQL